MAKVTGAIPHPNAHTPTSTHAPALICSAPDAHRPAANHVACCNNGNRGVSHLTGRIVPRLHALRTAADPPMTRFHLPLAIAVAAALASSAAAVPARTPAVRSAAVQAVEVTPCDLRLVGRGTQDRLFVTAVLPSGERRDVTAAATFRITGSSAAVGAGGTVTAHRDGRAAVTVTYGGRQAKATVHVSDAASDSRISFRYDVQPALSRAGCNQGACHGNGEGKGGLRLSLKGEDAAFDYQALAVVGGSRRVNRADPGASLLLHKGTGAVPHGGGQRFSPASPEFQAVAGWIAQGARPDPADAPRLVRLELSPRSQVVIAPARMQRLAVVGHYSDGSVRNVASKVIYLSSDPAVAVTLDGKVSTRSGGDSAIMVRYADQFQTARLTFVPARRDYAWKPVAAHNGVDAINFPLLKQLRLTPSRLTTDAEFLRRAYLDALGVLPTPAEVREFLAECEAERVQSVGGKAQGAIAQTRHSRAPTHPHTHTSTPPVQSVPALETRARWIEKLLERPEFADFWTMKWGDILRLEERSLDTTGAAAYQRWLRESIAANKPLDQFARELLTASGSTYANPPANYYRRTRTPLELAETTAQVFMGTRILCAKCHNHPFEAWKQDDYFALAAFFPRLDRKIEKLTRKDSFDKHELNGEEIISVTATGEVEDPRTNQPVSPRLPLVSQQPDLSAVPDRRVPFAEWLTRPNNPYFARAMVNRIWYHLMGRGLVEPVDDLRESNPASNPALLDFLARDFVAHKFDFKHVVRTIMNSRTYQLASETNGTNADDERFFSRAIPQRVPAEVLLDALSQATESPESFPNYPSGTRAVQLPAVRNRSAFLASFGQPARESVCECERSGETTLAQSFTLISGAGIDGKLKRPDNRVGRLLQTGRTNPDIVTEFYLATLTREPTASERASAVAYIASKPNRRAALEDLLWALLNSKEFLLRR